MRSPKSLIRRKIDEIRPSIVSKLDNLTLEESLQSGCVAPETLHAAQSLALDRSYLAGDSQNEPDEMEVHHALFLLRRARGLAAPSFDTMRFRLRRRLAGLNRRARLRDFARVRPLFDFGGRPRAGMAPWAFWSSSSSA